MELSLSEIDALRRVARESGEQGAADALDVDRLTFTRALARLPLQPRSYRRIAARLAQLAGPSGHGAR